MSATKKSRCEHTASEIAVVDMGSIVVLTNTGSGLQWGMDMDLEVEKQASRPNTGRRRINTLVESLSARWVRDCGNTREDRPKASGEWKNGRCKPPERRLTANRRRSAVNSISGATTCTPLLLSAARVQARSSLIVTAAAAAAAGSTTLCLVV